MAAHQPFTPSLASIVKLIEADTTLEGQTALLKKHSSPALKAIIGYAMDPGIVWMLPPGTPPYKTNEELDNEGRFYKNSLKLLNFIRHKDGGKRFTNLKRESLFVNMLETIHPEDAKLLIRIKDRLLTIRMDAVKSAFPTLTKEWK